MRAIVRKGRPHPGAHLTVTDVDGRGITAFATNTRAGGSGTDIADLDLRPGTEPPAKTASAVRKMPDCAHSPCSTFAQNQIWCAIVVVAMEITAWMQMLALTDHPARRWEPRRLPRRLFTVPATMARTVRRVLLHFAVKAPWAQLAQEGITRLCDLTAPGRPTGPVPTAPTRSPARGTDARPRRHSGHTQVGESERLQPRRDRASAPQKVRGLVT